MATPRASVRPPRGRRPPLLILLSPPLLLLLSASPLPALSEPPPPCSADGTPDLPDPDLRTMTFDIGYGPESFDAYVDPDVSTFYRMEPGSRTPVRMDFNGLAGKFVNMSPDRLKLYWDPGPNSRASLIGSCDPFKPCGTATFPGHRFFLSPSDDPETRVATFTVQEGRMVYYHDPYDVPGDPSGTRDNLRGLPLADYEKYERYHRSRTFAERYLKFTGREYLAVYAREGPSHFMWRADYFGQEHWAATRETHFKETPPDGELGKIRAFGRDRVLAEDEPRLLAEYRTGEPLMNMTMTVLSCRPRAFEIRDFLSRAEVDHILKVAGGVNLRKSRTGEGSSGSGDDRKIRTSRNSWVPREESPIIDAVYRRAADLLRIDESLLRRRSGDERADRGGTRGSVAETLQLVHYGAGQEYTPHHDFGYASQHRPEQPARFATLLLYLNEGMEGGETSFPRWLNAHDSGALRVVPEVGKAVLFYSQLPDGNMDDLSQHAAVPVRVGEKWLINLWVHDPIYEK